MMKAAYYVLIALALMLFTAATPAHACKDHDAPTGTVKKVSTKKGQIWVSGAPNKSQLKKYRDQNGLKTVIDFREGKETKKAEKAAKSLGLNYANIPVSVSSLSQGKIYHMEQILRNRENYPVLLHCASGQRAAMMYALHRIYDDHVGVERAIKDAEALGLTQPELKQAIRDFQRNPRKYSTQMCHGKEMCGKEKNFCPKSAKQSCGH